MRGRRARERVGSLKKGDPDSFTGTASCRNLETFGTGRDGRLKEKSESDTGPQIASTAEVSRDGIGLGRGWAH
jgi:hypothetical protein